MGLLTFLKENKVWVLKSLYLLLATITPILFFSFYLPSPLFSRCAEFEDGIIGIGVGAFALVVITGVIFLFQWKNKEKDTVKYTQLDIDLDSKWDDAEAKKKAIPWKSIFTVIFHIFTIIFMLILVGLVISYAVYTDYYSLPKINGSMKLKGLISDATIERESNGVLHVKADNMHDLFFAQGVAMAQERLWQMEFHRRVGRGTLSEILGNATLDTDRFILTLGFWNFSQAALNYLSNDSLLVLDSYVEGVNSYLDTDPPLPPEFHLLGFKPAHFIPADALLMIKFLSLELAGNYQDELTYHYLMYARNISQDRIKQLNPSYPTNAPTILNDDEISHINFTYTLDPINWTFPASFQDYGQKFEAPQKKISIPDLLAPNGLLQGLNLGFKSASNNWVMNGSHTASKKPLLCNDPHLTLTAPSIWLLMHLECPGLNVIGATPVGMPGITIGRTPTISWGVTNTFVDVQDFYILDVNEDGTGYYVNGTEYAFVIRHEVILIKGQPNFEMNVRLSRYGPVLSDVVDMQGQTAALLWTSLDDKDTTFDTLMKIATAQHFEDFRDSLSTFVAPAQNFIFADTAGNIGYQCPGLIPVRVEGHTGQFAVPGNGSYDWKGWIPRNELPYVKNPAKGYIVTANNKLQPPTYPYLILNDHDWEPHYRALRIIEMLETSSNHTVQTQMRMQYNQVTGIWADFFPLLKTVPSSSLNAAASSWLAALLEWDGNELTGSVDATVFEYWIYVLGKLGAPETGYDSWAIPYFLLNTLRNDSDPLCKGSCGQVMADALSTAVSMLGNKKAPNAPAWGTRHTLHIDHPVMSQSPLGCAFDRELPYGGNSYTVNVGAMPSRHKDDGMPPFVMTVGPSYRQIADLNDMDNSKFIIPMGQSGNVFDKNYDSMLDDYMTDKYTSMKTSGYSVADELTLKP